MNFNLINWWSTTGLVFDLAGVMVLFEYGLPSKVRQHIGGRLVKESNETASGSKHHNSRIKKMSYIGLALILLGFVMQLLGTNIQAME